MALSEVRKVEGYQPVKLNHSSSTHLTSFFCDILLNTFDKMFIDWGPLFRIPDQHNFDNKLWTS